MSHHFQHRPLHLRLLNGCGSLVSQVGLYDRRVNADQLLAKACANTGLDDFGPPDFEVPFRLLVDSYNTEADLNFVGCLSARTHLLQLLENRLRVERDRQQEPKIAAQEIKSPVFILGLPRTGSTLLFELMSRNPQFRTPLTWEVMLPSPPPRMESFQTDPRIAKVERLLGYLHRIAPDFQSIHAMGARLPQECLAMLAQSFRSLQFHTTHHVPTYQAWLQIDDLVPAYEYHRRLLQHFQAFGPPGTWLLKAPAHLFGIEALFRVYPDARIVQTHRDPVQVAGSISSHCATLRQAFSEQLDLHDIGSTWCSLWAQGLHTTLEFRRHHPEWAGRFLDVYYEDLTRDPILALRQIQDQLDLPLTPPALQAAQSYLEDHPQSRHGRHTYDLADFGLSPARVRQCFGDYRGQRSAPVPGGKRGEGRNTSGQRVA